MSNSTGNVSATDAVRYLYLARVTERQGQLRAAQRWREKAERWMETIAPGKLPTGACPPDY